MTVKGISDAGSNLLEPLEPPEPPRTPAYSVLSASTGSIRIARRAGTHDATPAIASSSAAIEMNVAASVGSTPNSKRLEESRQPESRKDTEHSANRGKAEGAAHDLACDRPRLGAEREANPDLPAPLRDRVRHDGVNADRAEEERQRGETGGQLHRESPASRVFGIQLGDGPDVL